ncbi:MAG: hypothetical protein JWO24_3164 [Rhodospirillales bacterium]|nr:hypothetical protein [Rhodospirillales bacterium]
MRDLIQGAINTKSQRVGEAKRTGLGVLLCTMAALPATIIDQAVEQVLTERQLLPPVPARVEIDGRNSKSR